MKKLWISWEDHRRTKEIARHLDITPCVFTSGLPRLLKYPVLIARTSETIWREKPVVLFVQTPSIVLAVFCCMVKPLFGFRLVADLHNGAIVPERWFQKAGYFFYKFVHITSDLNIVTNHNLEKLITAKPGAIVILPDRLPSFSQSFSRPDIVKNVDKYVVAVCTFSVDEPYVEIIEAARLIPDDVKVVVTGNHKRCPTSIKDCLPSNVILSGYVPEAEYINLLYYSEVVIDLTNRDDCLVCGAYEAIGLTKPVILSDTIALRKYFHGGVFCKNDRYHLKDAVESVLQNYDHHLLEASKLKQRLLQEWSIYEHQLLTKLSEMVS